MTQKKLLSEQKENDQEFTLRQSNLKESVVKTTKSLTEVKEDKTFNSTYILDDWDNWHPDPMDYV